MFEYAIVSDDEKSVLEYRNYPNALDLHTVKKLPNGRLKIRPVTVTEALFDPLTHDVTETVEILSDVVMRTQIAKAIPHEELTIRHNATVQRDINSLERDVMLPRVVREFMLGFMEANATPEQLAANIGYTKVKALDDQIAALRRSKV